MNWGEPEGFYQPLAAMTSAGAGVPQTILDSLSGPAYH